MGKKTGIAWCDSTFNPWIGCEKISPACDNCYAATYAKRIGEASLWQGNRRRTGESNWRQPLKWNIQAAKDGTRPRVFCASLADVFDNAVDPQWRRDLFELIRRTSQLDWLLLTKRIGNASRMLSEAFWNESWSERPLPNVWIGATICNQAEADRDIPKLLQVPAAVRFLSIEPQLELIDLTEHLWGRAIPCNGCDPFYECECGYTARSKLAGEACLHWVICGGESGHHARPLAEGWAVDLRTQCLEADVKFFFKQGSEANWPAYDDYSTYPPTLQVREFPR